MPQYAILRIGKIKSVTAGNARLKHNRRELLSHNLIGNPKNNVSILHPNEKQLQTQTKTFAELFRERTEGQKIRKNATYAIEVILTFSPDAVRPEQLKEWTAENAEWIKKQFGSQNVIDCKLHLDESTPHIHAVIIPIDDRGRLNARAFIGGSRNRLSEIQTEYADAMKKFGLERGISRTMTNAKHNNYKKYAADLAEKEVRLHAYEQVFGNERTFNLDTLGEFLQAKHEASEPQQPAAPSKTIVINNDDIELSR